MKNKIITFILVFSFSFIVFNACDDTEPILPIVDDDGIQNIDSTFLKYFGPFGDSSTYIFKSSSNLLDTMIIASSSEGVFIDVDKGRSYEGFFARYESTQTPAFGTKIYPDSLNEQPRMNSRIFYDNLSDHYIRYQNGLFYPIDKVNILNSITLNGEVFHDVLEFTEVGYGYKKLLFAKNIGLIQKTTINNEIYSILSYKIRP